MSCSREKRYQALHAFPYCKRRKAGRGLGTRLGLGVAYDLHKVLDIHDRSPPHKGGNDYEIFEDARTIGHRVTNPEDTRRQVEELFK